MNKSTLDHWTPITKNAAKELLDMSAGNEAWSEIGKKQLSGAVALYNRLAEKRFTWLCDEVGLGKTYIAMAVAALVRKENPKARILYLLPSSRLLPKWKRELAQFSKKNVIHVDHALKTIQGEPARPLVEAKTMFDLAFESYIDPERDFLCTLGAFSFGLKFTFKKTKTVEENIEEMLNEWKKSWRPLASLMTNPKSMAPSWEEISSRLAKYLKDKQTDDGIIPHRFFEETKAIYKKLYAECMNLILPEFDLIICDESHNLRKGLSSGAARNQTLSRALGGISTETNIVARRILEMELDEEYNITPKSKRVLCLTATPFADSFAELSAQASVFGFSKEQLGGWNSNDAYKTTIEELSTLCKVPVGTDKRIGFSTEQKEVAKEFIIRRIGTLQIDGEDQTRNRYRLEYRAGGMESPDKKSKELGLRESLLLSLVQKRVMDSLSTANSNAIPMTRFPMGVLSSFESFQQDLDTKQNSEKENAIEGEATKEAKNRASDEDKAIKKLLDSYFKEFDKHMSHPKLDFVAESCAQDAIQGEKSLIFVRRVKTTSELALRITQVFDHQLNTHIQGALDKHQEEWSTIWAGYKNSEREDRPSLFNWYFRDSDSSSLDEKNNAGTLVKKRLVEKNLDGLLLYENHLLTYFQHDTKQLEQWLNGKEEQIAQQALLIIKTQDPVSWFQAHQAAAFDVLQNDESLTVDQKEMVSQLRTLYPPTPEKNDSSQNQSGLSVHQWLTCPTLFSELLQHHPNVIDMIWKLGSVIPISKERNEQDKTEPTLRDRELRKMMTVALLRNGWSFIDLWLAVAQETEDSLHSIGKPKFSKSDFSNYSSWVKTVARNFSARLGTENHTIFGAQKELRLVQENFEQLIDLNFPDVRDLALNDAYKNIRDTLTGQKPVVALHGKNPGQRVMKQFRMPGMPFVMVATSVVQEGVDLHTFCRKVVHYGIDSSCTGTEQRNGRVDRYGSMIQRLVQKDSKENIHIYFPHLQESLEPLQMMELYHRMNRFLVMSHNIPTSKEDDMINITEKLTEGVRYPKQYKKPLETSFPVPSVPKNAKNHLSITPVETLQADIWSSDQWIPKSWNAKRLGKLARWETGKLILGVRSDFFSNHYQKRFLKLHLDFPIQTISQKILKPNGEIQKMALHEKEEGLPLYNPPGLIWVAYRKGNDRWHLRLRAERFFPLSENPAVQLKRWKKMLGQHTSYESLDLHAVCKQKTIIPTTDTSQSQQALIRQANPNFIIENHKVKILFSNRKEPRKQFVRFANYQLHDQNIIGIESQAISLEKVHNLFNKKQLDLDDWLHIMAHNDHMSHCSLKLEHDGLWVYEYLTEEEFYGEHLRKVIQRVAETADGLEERFTHQDEF